MNNGKKYLLIGVAVLFILVILVAVLQSAIKGGPATPAPTTQVIPTPFGGGRKSGTNRNSGAGGSTSSTGELPAVVQEKRKNELINKLPINTSDFTIDYSPVMDKIVVTRKSPNAEEKLDIWEQQNGYSDVLSDYNDTLVANQSVKDLENVLGVPTKTLEQQSKEQSDGLSDFVRMIISIPDTIVGSADKYKEDEKLTPTVTPTPLPSPTAAPTSSAGEPKSYNGYVYYSQCRGQYDNYPLTPGCNLCRAGCGPTTVSMILSSYVDKKYTPPTVVELYRNITSTLCGTSVDVAKRVLNSNGVKTTDYILVNPAGANVKDVADDFREYIKNGWTIMALTYFKPNQGGGHYFWITDVDSQGNVMAYDPYYGMDQTPPINENVRYPFPTYWYAFGVKKQ